MQKHYDAIIIGGSLVGASAALALAQLNLKIAVIEGRDASQRCDPGDDGRAIVLSPTTIRFFKNLNLWREFAEVATLIKNIHVSEKGRFGATRMSAEKQNLDYLAYVVEAHNIQGVLTTACLQHKNIDYLCPAQGVDFIIRDNVSVTINYQEKMRELSGDLLIAADGANSPAREKLGVQATTWDYGQTAVVANIGLNRSHGNVAYERFSKLGPQGMIPMRGNRCGLVWGLETKTAEEFLQLSELEFLQKLQESFGYRLGKLTTVSKRAAYPLKLTRAQQLVGDKWVLLGNAAQSLHPIAGQGFNLGVRDIAQLMQTLKDQQSLASYEKARFWDQSRVITFSDTLNRLYTNPLGSISLLREIGMLAIEHLPGLKTTFMRHTMGTAGSKPEILCAE